MKTWIYQDFLRAAGIIFRLRLEKQVLIISLGAKLKVGKCKAIRDWFLANEFADFGDPFTNFFMSRRLPKGFVEDKNVQQKVVEYFASFDEHIKDFRIEKVPHDGETRKRIPTKLMLSIK